MTTRAIDPTTSHTSHVGWVIAQAWNFCEIVFLVRRRLTNSMIPNKTQIAVMFRAKSLEAKVHTTTNDTRIAITTDTTYSLYNRSSFPLAVASSVLYPILLVNPNSLKRFLTLNTSSLSLQSGVCTQIT